MALNKNLLGYLSIKGEVGESADPGTVSQNENDAGGWSYGLFQFNSANGIVQGFVAWLQEQGVACGEWLAAAGDPICERSFVAAWRGVASVDPEGFAALQDQYAKAMYYDPAADRLREVYGFDITGHSRPLQQVLFSNSVQHGPTYGADAFPEGATAAGRVLAGMTDAEIIAALYNNKLKDKAWSKASPELRPGLFARWRRERDEAIALI